MKYVKYNSFFGQINNKNYISENVIPYNMSVAQSIGFKKLEEYILSNEKYENKPLNCFKWLQDKLNISTKKELLEILSFEQMDSVAAAIYNIENQQSFMIADETGIGKGRILASILRYGIVNKKNVIFFTEGTHLFSDFYRDLKDIGFEDKIGTPFLMHSKAKIINQDNEIVFKSLSKKNLEEVYDSKKIDTKVIMTTYSQFNREGLVKKKLELFKNYIKSDTILLFDETHNAIGDSTVRETKEEIKKIGGIPIEASATFLDDFKKMNSFFNLLNISKDDEKAIELFSDNNLSVSNQLAFNMSSNLKMLRREHSEVININYSYLTDEDNEKVKEYLNNYRNLVYSMFDCYSYISSKSEDIERKNKWVVFGDYIVRVGKAILLMAKEDFLVKRCLNYIQMDMKCVITIDSTFSSAIQSCIDYLKDNSPESVLEDKKYKEINLHTFLKAIVNNIFLEDYTKFKDDKTFQQMFNKIKTNIDNFPSLEISVIDNIKTKLKKHGVNTLEISGRTNELIKFDNEDNLYELISKKEVDKSIIINDFNNNFDNMVIIITRSGSTGTSLHSSSKFKDQRKRVMLEYEISNRAKTRLQYFGRVKRKGQVCEPEFECIVSNTLFEKRIINLEEQKLSKLRSYVGSDYTIKNNDDYYNDYCNYLVYIFLIEKGIGLYRRLGIDITNETSMYFIDSILKRSILLTDNEQEELFDYLDEGLENYNNLLNDTAVDYLNIDEYNQVTINKVELLFENCSHFTRKEFEKTNKKEWINTSFPVVCLAEIVYEKNLENVTEVELKNNLKINQSKFNKDFYKDNISNVYIDCFYDDKSKVKENLKKLKELNIYDLVKFNLNENVHFAYVENIEIPKNNLLKYSSHYIYTLVIINPKNLKNENVIFSNKLRLMGNLLLENLDFEIYKDREIDFSKFIRDEKTIIEKKEYLLMGNPLYVNSYANMYKIGESISFLKNIDNELKQFYAVKIPNKYNTKEKIHKLFEYAPLLQTSSILDRVVRDYQVLSNNNEIVIKMNNVQPNFKLNSFDIKILDTVFNNPNLITYKSKKMLKVKAYKNKYYYISITYNEFTRLLYSFNSKFTFKYKPKK